MSVDVDEHDPKIPRLLIRAIGAVMLISLGLAAYGAATGMGDVRLPASEPVETRSLAFEERGGAVLAVLDAETGDQVALLDETEGGFLRGVLRGLERGRVVRGDGGEAPLSLTRWADGRLTISDPVTGDLVQLNVFGADNLDAFARLLKSREDAG